MFRLCLKWNKKGNNIAVDPHTEKKRVDVMSTVVETSRILRYF